MKRAVRTLIRIIAAAMIVFGGLAIGLELEHRAVQIHNHVDPIKTNIWYYIVGVLLLVLGVIIFLGGDSLAEQLTDDIDE